MGYEGIRGRTGARAWEVIHIYTGSFTPSPDPTPFYRRLISTRKGGLTTNGIHLLIPASLSNRSGPPQAALGTRARRTAFRKLKELPYRTSYSHRGGYYTLEELIDFDQHGLWSFRAVRFSAAASIALEPHQIQPLHNYTIRPRS